MIFFRIYLYRAIESDVDVKELVYFRNGYGYEHEATWKQHRNS
jgi:hypothetical protein